MKENSEIRQDSLALLKGNWGSVLVITLLFHMFIFACSIVAIILGSALSPAYSENVLGDIFSLIVTVFVYYPMVFAVAKLFLHFVRQEQPLGVNSIFKGFSSPYFSKAVVSYLLISIYTFLWTLLLIVPGVIKSLAYSLTPYVLIDNPELSADEAINRSMQLMRGHKMQLFLMELGFVGLALLSLLALGIPLLWLYPYYQTVWAKFYEEVKSSSTTVC